MASKKRQSALQRKRSKAAKKGWATRRRKARSAAAKRGWETRRKAAAKPAPATYVPLTPREAKERDRQRELAREEQARLRSLQRASERPQPEIADDEPDIYPDDDDDSGESDYSGEGDYYDYGHDDVRYAGESDFDLDYDDDFFGELEDTFEEFEFEKLS